LKCVRGRGNFYIVLADAMKIRPTNGAETGARASQGAFYNREAGQSGRSSGFMEYRR